MQDVSKNQIVDLYSSLLNLVITNNDVGLIIKSKYGILIKDINF